MANKKHNRLVALLLALVVFESRMLGGKFNAGIFYVCLFAMLEIYAPPPLDFWFQGDYRFENDRGEGFFFEHLYGYACVLSLYLLFKEFPKWRERRKQD